MTLIWFIAWVWTTPSLSFSDPNVWTILLLAAIAIDLAEPSVVIKR